MGKVGRPKGSISSSKQYDCTIEKPLFEVWKRNTKRKDIALIAVKLGYSQQVIGRALKYGHVLSDELKDGISTFFLERIRRDEAAAKKLIDNSK